MKYLINRRTKQHVIAPENHRELFSAKWDIVQADDDGWIKHEGNECPLPDDVRCEVKNEQGVQWEVGWMLLADNFYWPAVSAYRPILAEKAQEPEPTLEPPVPSLFEQLGAAHQAASQIPDIIAQIKAKLEQYGHTVVPLSPFVEAEPAVETPQDMSDWRNWREGDVLICSTTALNSGSGFTFGCLYALIKSGIDSWLVDDDEHYRPLYGNAYRFSFHSRPAKGEK